ncbi:MAG TPA: hypothetical protein H9856_05650, partial [Candidatus Limosilactobacillus merdigallinarum]|nr:hypothetical protein [Candidatus Limosilactobacillus merdigallinarum]
MPTRQQAAREFVKTWSTDNKGREDADRQTFWNDLLQLVYGIVKPSDTVPAGVDDYSYLVAAD